MPGLSEVNIYQALGLTAPETNAGANAQEPAEPAALHPAADQTTGANAQEPAEPAPTDAANHSNTEPDNPNDPGQADPVEQSPEERRANAARRRQQEQQAAIDAAVAAARQDEQQKAQEAMRNLFSQAGMRNTYTGDPITTQQEFEAWQTQFRNDQLQKQLAEGKLTVEGLHALVEDHPVVKQAKANMAAQTQDPVPSNPSAANAATPNAAQQAVDVAQQAADAAKIHAEIAEISKLDPSVKSLGDILNSPTGKEFYGYVQKGYSFLDAFRVANFDRLTSEKAQAARQQAQINDRGKGHMTGAGNSRGSGAISVPADVMAMFRTFNPNATEAEAQAYYNKYKKGH